MSKIMTFCCDLFGHVWRYNFPLGSMPSKRICKYCKKREKLNLETLTFGETFEDKRTDEELLKAFRFK